MLLAVWLLTLKACTSQSFFEFPSQNLQVCLEVDDASKCCTAGWRSHALPFWN